MTDNTLQELLRMDAYYYSFKPTGNLAIDRILSAVACAGKGFHHTQNWNDTLEQGDTYVERIQKAADEAARTPVPSVTEDELASILHKARMGYNEEHARLAPLEKVEAQAILTQFNVSKKE